MNAIILYTFSDGAALSYQPGRSISERRWFIDGQIVTFEAYLTPRAVQGVKVAGVARKDGTAYMIRAAVLDQAKALDAAAPQSLDGRVAKIVALADDVADARGALYQIRAGRIEATLTSGVAPNIEAAVSRAEAAVASAEAAFAAAIHADPEADAVWQVRSRQARAAAIRASEAQ